MALKPQLYLASSSPQRRGILAMLPVNFDTLIPEIDESVQLHEAPADYVQRLAVEKARRGALLLSHSKKIPVLGADTCVVVSNKILGKPDSKEHAFEMLNLLSGQVHQVFTAVAVATESAVSVECSENQVEFSPIDENQLEDYWKSGESINRAGAYAIQGLAANFVARLDGSYSAVIGLPVDVTIKLLRECGIRVPSYRQFCKSSALQVPDSCNWSGDYRL